MVFVTSTVVTFVSMGLCMRLHSRAPCCQYTLSTTQTYAGVMVSRLYGSHAGQLFSSGSFGTCHLLLCIGSYTFMSTTNFVVQHDHSGVHRPRTADTAIRSSCEWCCAHPATWSRHRW